MKMVESVPLKVKWGKETLKLDFVIASGVKGLKTELEEKTGVPADRMKIMPKSKGLWKGVLKDDFDLSTVDFSAAMTKASGKELQILLMGSGSKLTGPKTKTVFLEDLPPDEVAKVREPSGLVNLGNTCYMNSVVQCLRAVPELRKGIANYTPSTSNSHLLGNAAGGTGSLVVALRDTFNNLDRSVDAIPPTSLLRVSRMIFPQFAQRGPQGQPKQQDAEEFLSTMLATFAENTNRRETINAGLSSSTDEELNGATNLIDAVFGLRMEETLTCDEFDSTDSNKKGEAMDVDAGSSALVEPAVIKYDLQRKLVCNIQGGSDAKSTTNVDHIAEGIALSLSGKIEKHSEVLGRNAIWTRKQRIARLPPIIGIQFGRFYWKETPDSSDHTGVKCKVMKPVAFSDILDVYEFCSESIQKSLKVVRDRKLAEEEDAINKKLKGQLEDKEKEKKDDSKMEIDQVVEETNANAAGGSEEDALKEAIAMSMEETQPPVGPGLPKDFQGMYELFAVVTHKGRDADGGHYMAWVKAEGDFGNVKKIEGSNVDNENWFVFDDDEVSPCKTEDVLKLKGGGDWHMSYLNFYRAKK